MVSGAGRSITWSGAGLPLSVGSTSFVQDIPSELYGLSDRSALCYEAGQRIAGGKIASFIQRFDTESSGRFASHDQVPQQALDPTVHRRSRGWRHR